MISRIKLLDGLLLMPAKFVLSEKKPRTFKKHFMYLKIKAIRNISDFFFSILDQNSP